MQRSLEGGGAMSWTQFKYLSPGGRVTPALRERERERERRDITFKLLVSKIWKIVLF